jgi:hypothetical protein
MTFEGLILAAAVTLLLAAGAWRSVQLWRNAAADLDNWPVGVLRAFPTMIGMMDPVPGLGGDDGPA